MKKRVLLLFILPVIYLVNPLTANSQSGINALMNVVETLQFLKDIKENNGKVETIAKEIKGKYKEGDSTYSVLKDKYTIVKLSADNILNNLIIDLMDRDKRKMFADRPSLINDYYTESVQLYNKSVDEFNAAYQRSKKGDTGFLNFLKKAAELLLGDLISVAKKIAIEALIERLKAPYTMKSWKEI